MPLSTQSQALVTTFNASLTADQQTNFASALQNSPALVDQINTAVAANQLSGFSLLAAGTHAGGQFNPTARTMELPASIIATPTGGTYNPGELTFVMGHEIQHAVNQPTTAAAVTAFSAEVNRIAQTPQATHDYTAALGTMLTVNRNDEATAHIAGFNANVSMVRSTNATPSLEDIYRANPARMQDFITVTPATPGTPAVGAAPATPGTPAAYALRTGLTLNADMSMTANAANTNAMGQHFFDKPASVSRLGHNGDSNYQNYYAGSLVGFVAQVERFHAPAMATAGVAPQLTLNMTTLGVSEAQLERNGLDLGAAAGRQPYFNSATTPPTAGNFDHTIATHAHVPISMPNALPDMPAPVARPEHAAAGHAASGHAASGHAASGHATPEHAAVRQAMDALDRSPNIPADAFGADRQRVAAGVALHAASQQVAPDHIVLNQQRTDLIAVQGGLSDPGARLSTPLPVAEAMRTDVQQVSAKLDAPQPAQQQPAQQQNPVAQQDAPQQEAVKARAQ